MLRQHSCLAQVQCPLCVQPSVWSLLKCTSKAPGSCPQEAVVDFQMAVMGTSICGSAKRLLC